MKTGTQLLLAGATIAAIGTVMVAGLAIASERHGDGGREGRGFGGPAMIEQYDANGDGTLTQAEIDAFRQSRVDQFDGNGDGNLTIEEFEALWADGMRPRMVDRFQHLDEDGDGIVTSEEFQAPFSRMVSRMDRNDDGEITADEMQRRGKGRRGYHDDDEDDEYGRGRRHDRDDDD